MRHKLNSKRGSRFQKNMFLKVLQKLKPFKDIHTKIIKSKVALSVTFSQLNR